MIIPDAVKEYLRTHLAYVATVDARGRPHVVPKGELAVLDDGTIVFVDLYSHQTKKNLSENRHIAITVVNPAGYSGYQVKGTAAIVERGPAYDRLRSQAAQLNHPQAKYAVRVRPNRIIDIGYGPTADQELKTKQRI